MPGPKISRRDAHLLIAAACAVPALPALAQPARQPPAARLPTQAFAQLPLMQGLSLSPDGTHIAGFVNIEDGTVLVLRAVAPGSALLSVLKTDNVRFHFNWVKWLGDDRLVASMRYAANRSFVGTQETRLVSFRRDGSGILNLDMKADMGGTMIGSRPSLQVQDRVVDWLPEDGKSVLLALGDGPGLWPGLHKVDVSTGMRQQVLPARRGVRDWIVDNSHTARVGIALEEDRFEIVERSGAGKDWRTLWSFERYSDAAVWPMGFGVDPNILWVRAWHNGHLAVFSVDLAAPGLPRTLRMADEGVDLEGDLLKSARTGEVIGLRSTSESGADHARDEIWDPEHKALALAIDGSFPGLFNSILSFSRDEQRYLLYSSGNGQPGRYYIGDRARGSLTLLTDTYPDLPPAQLVGKQKVSIAARDGLVLNAYLSRPRGAAEGELLPLVMLPHGGPHSRDDADFDSWTELLANRGYAVLQVNFRGSDGQGLAHKLAGLRRWGLEMQDDLTDAAQWAVAQRIADPRRLAIVGGSYGGYAALMGVVKTPRLYRCAISFAGVSDLEALILQEGDYVGGAKAAEAAIGRVWGDRERLRATSPVLQAGRIEVPVLLVHGTADRSVPASHSQAMARALSSAGKSHRYIEQEGGDHYLSRYKYRLEFFRAIEAFLAQHLAAAA